MNNVNQTLYIPLYGKAYVSRKGIILKDSKAEYIWDKEKFELKGKSKSKWLAYYMGMRSAVFDSWANTRINAVQKSNKSAVVIHIGCGMDSRVERIGCDCEWYDVDFPSVIEERKRYYEESSNYHMIKSDAREVEWLNSVPTDKHAIVIMEGVTMYFQVSELKKLLKAISTHFDKVSLLMDCYTDFAAKASKYKNPINDVGVTEVVGIDNPHILEEDTGFKYLGERTMTPKSKVDELKGMEKVVFRFVFGGAIARKMYRMYEFKKI